MNTFATSAAEGNAAAPTCESYFSPHRVHTREVPPQLPQVAQTPISPPPGCLCAPYPIAKGAAAVPSV